MNTDLSQIMAVLRERDSAIVAACDEARAVFKKHFPMAELNLNAPGVLASCIELFDIEDPKDAGQLYLEWVVEHFVGRKVRANIEDVKKVVETLKEKGFTEDNPHVFNDMDNTLFYIPHETKLIFCSTSQNTRYIYILDGHKFHVRRYYAEYNTLDDDDWRREEEESYKEKGIQKAIANAFWLAEEWSDCLPGSTYPVRPSLQYFKDCDFKPQYGDCRDIGYVLSYGGLIGHPRVDRAIFFYSEIKPAFFALRIAVERLEAL